MLIRIRLEINMTNAVLHWTFEEPLQLDDGSWCMEVLLQKESNAVKRCVLFNFDEQTMASCSRHFKSSIEPIQISLNGAPNA